MDFTLLAVAVSMIQSGALMWKFVVNRQVKDALGLLIVVVLGVIVAFLIRASDFGTGFKVTGLALSDLNQWSTVLVGYALASAAVLTHKVIKGIDNQQSAVEPQMIPPEA